MAAGRTLKSLLSRRRRAEDDGEEEEGPVVVEDSQSEVSMLTEPEDDEEEGDGSSLVEASGAVAGSGEPTSGNQEAAATGIKQKKARKSRKKPGKKSQEAGGSSPSQPQTNFQPMADTEAMMNGLKISEGDPAQDEVVGFESTAQKGTATTGSVVPNGHATTPAERQRREHEQYRKKRDADPAFIPNRGNFFMHDTRGQPNGQAPPIRGAWQGRGRARGGLNGPGPFPPVNQMVQNERAAEQPWKHDLHDAINEEPQIQMPTAAPTRSIDVAKDATDSTRLFPKPTAPLGQGQHRAISFDVSTLLGKAKVRLSLPGMKSPIIFSDVPINAYIRLPGHRPPLRRDKPVRVFIPGYQQRYIFPQTDRSFIFIPRQMRPNQQGFHRGHYQRSIGGYGYSSRRTSMYGGSMYSASVAPSRRSSLAGIARENAFSPVGSFVGMPSSRPVVRLPHSAHPYSAASTPIGPLSRSPYSNRHTTDTHISIATTAAIPGYANDYSAPATATEGNICERHRVSGNTTAAIG